MEIQIAEPNQIDAIVRMSIRAFETDTQVGGAEGDCPPGYDSTDWHRQMAADGHLYQAIVDGRPVGGAILFPDETGQSLYIGRIFIDSAFHRCGCGLQLMQCIEAHFPTVREFHLDTPCWNIRTNRFYQKLGYQIEKEEDGFNFYRKIRLFTKSCTKRSFAHLRSR